MPTGLHAHSFVDTLYIQRTQVGRGLLSVKDCVELERYNLFDNAANNERLSKAVNEELQLRTKIIVKNEEERENGRQAGWKEKALQGHFQRETEGKQDERRW